MGLLSALNTAASGLRTTQAGIDLVSQNVANAGSAGYTRRVLQPVQALSGDRTTGVRTGEVQRTLNTLAQKQLWLERAGAAYTGLSSQVAAQVDALFGRPGTEASLEGAVNGFQKSAQALAADPTSSTARGALIAQGQALASAIGSAAGGVQALRTEAEARIGSAVGRVNDLLSGIAALNGRAASGTPSAALQDERDRLTDALSQFLDVRASTDGDGTVRLSTSSGQSLVDGAFAARLGFDARGTLDPSSAYSTDPGQRGVGTLTLVTAGGGSVDLVAAGAIRSGEIAAALQARDVALPQVQRQLDELAAGLSRALSDRPIAGTATTSGGAGFQIALESWNPGGKGWQPGNEITVELTVNGAAQRLTLVPVNGPPGAASPDGTVPFDMRGGDVQAAATALNTALAQRGIPLNVAWGGAAAPTTLRFLDASTGAGAAQRTGHVTAVSGSATATGLTDGTPALPFFVDSGTRPGGPFTGAVEGGRPLAGLAQRLAVNPDLAANPSRLVVYATAPATPQGDTARPQFIADALGAATRTFASAGLGGVDQPVTATVAEYARRVIEAGGAAAEAAASLDSGQGVAVAAAEGRFSAGAAVSIDDEMARLVELQTAYGANARLMSAVRDMLDTLLRM